MQANTCVFTVWADMCACRHIGMWAYWDADVVGCSGETWVCRLNCMQISVKKKEKLTY